MIIVYRHSVHINNNNDYCLRHSVKDYESKVQSLSQSLQKVTEERNDLQLLAAHHDAVVLHLSQEGEKRANALQV